jgi:hypothetical protein
MQWEAKAELSQEEKELLCATLRPRWETVVLLLVEVEPLLSSSRTMKTRELPVCVYPSGGKTTDPSAVRHRLVSSPVEDIRISLSSRLAVPTTSTPSSATVSAAPFFQHRCRLFLGWLFILAWLGRPKAKSEKASSIAVHLTARHFARPMI